MRVTGVVHVFAPEAMVQEEAEEVSVPDIAGAGLTTTVAVAAGLLVPKELVQVREYVYVLTVFRTP